MNITKNLSASEANKILTDSQKNYILKSARKENLKGPISINISVPPENQQSTLTNYNPYMSHPNGYMYPPPPMFYPPPPPQYQYPPYYDHHQSHQQPNYPYPPPLPPYMHQPMHMNPSYPPPPNYNSSYPPPMPYGYSPYPYYPPQMYPSNNYYHSNHTTPSPEPKVSSLENNDLLPIGIESESEVVNSLSDLPLKPIKKSLFKVANESMSKSSNDDVSNKSSKETTNETVSKSGRETKSVTVRRTLKQWFFIPFKVDKSYYDAKGNPLLRVGGLLENDEKWESSQIIKRITNRLVNTSNNSEYELLGPIHFNNAQKFFPFEFAELFKSGLSPNWVDDFTSYVESLTPAQPLEVTKKIETKNSRPIPATSSDLEKVRNQAPSRGVDKKIPRKVTPELVQDNVSQNSDKEKSPKKKGKKTEFFSDSASTKSVTPELVQDNVSHNSDKEKSPKKKGKKAEKISDSASTKSLPSSTSDTSSKTSIPATKIVEKPAAIEPKSYKDAIIDSDKKKVAVKKETPAVSMSMIDLCDGDISETTISDYSMKTITPTTNSTGSISSKTKSEKSKPKVESKVGSSLFDMNEIESEIVETKNKKPKAKSPTKSVKESPVKVNKNKRSQSETGNKENTLSSLMDLDCDAVPQVVPQPKKAQPSKVESAKPAVPKKSLQSELLSKALSSPLKSPPSLKAVQKPNLKSVAEEPKIVLSEVEMALNESKMLLQRRKDRR